MLDDEKSDMKCLQSSRSTIVETWFLHYLQPELSSSSLFGCYNPKSNSTPKSEGMVCMIGRPTVSKGLIWGVYV